MRPLFLRKKASGFKWQGPWSKVWYHSTELSKVTRETIDDGLSPRRTWWVNQRLATARKFISVPIPVALSRSEIIRTESLCIAVLIGRWMLTLLHQMKQDWHCLSLRKPVEFPNLCKDRESFYKLPNGPTEHQLKAVVAALSLILKEFPQTGRLLRLGCFLIRQAGLVTRWFSVKAKVQSTGYDGLTPEDTSVTGRSYSQWRANKWIQGRVNRHVGVLRNRIQPIRWTKILTETSLR